MFLKYVCAHGTIYYAIYISRFLYLYQREQHKSLTRDGFHKNISPEFKSGPLIYRAVEN